MSRKEHQIGGTPWPVGAALVLSIAACVTVTANAEAYVVRETSSGIPVRWPDPDIAVEVDPSLIRAVPDALEAATAAAAGWTSANAGPRLHVTLAAAASSPAVDGRNVVYFIPGYPAAGSALAVTLVSYDDATGAIVDADVVINGSYGFAVLPATARAPAGVTPISNEPIADDAGAPSVASAWGVGTTPGAAGPTWLELATARFDLVHVLAHETGHVLGLRDAPDETSDVMFLYSSPGDAVPRVPAADDVAGVGFLYGGTSASVGQGCAVARANSRPDEGATPALAYVFGAFVSLAAVLHRARRRAGSADGARPRARVPGRALRKCDSPESRSSRSSTHVVPWTRG